MLISTLVRHQKTRVLDSGLAMVAKYDTSDLRFVYPDNWTLDDEPGTALPRTVSVNSPGGAFWSITMHQPSADPGVLVNEALTTMRQEYPGLESQAIAEQIAATATTGHNLSFYYLDLLVAATIRAFSIGPAVCLIQCQAEDREFKQLGPVFQAITESLIDREVFQRV